MPRDLNEPPPLNAEVTGGRNVEHLDNTDINKSTPAFQDVARAAGQKSGADSDSDGKSAPSGPTVTVQGDLTGSTVVTAGTELMDALAKVDSSFLDYDYTRVNGSPVNPEYEVKGDLIVVAKKKAAEKSAESKDTSGGPNPPPAGGNAGQ